MHIMHQLSKRQITRSEEDISKYTVSINSCPWLAIDFLLWIMITEIMLEV